MKIAAAICILACVGAAGQAADAPANCKDETAYLNKWTYTGDNADCKKYLACPIQHEKMVPVKKQCKRLKYYDPTTATCSSTYKCPKTDEEKTAAKTKADTIKAAEDKLTPLETDTATKLKAKEEAEKTKTDAEAKAKTDAAALEAATKAVTDLDEKCKKDKEALETKKTEATKADEDAKKAVTDATQPATDAASAYETAKGLSDTAKTELETAKTT